MGDNLADPDERSHPTESRLRKPREPGIGLAPPDLSDPSDPATAASFRTPAALARALQILFALVTAIGALSMAARWVECVILDDVTGYTFGSLQASEDRVTTLYIGQLLRQLTVGVVFIIWTHRLTATFPDSDGPPGSPPDRRSEGGSSRCSACGDPSRSSTTHREVRHHFPKYPGQTHLFP